MNEVWWWLCRYAECQSGEGSEGRRDRRGGTDKRRRQTAGGGGEESYTKQQQRAAVRWLPVIVVQW